MRPSAACPNCSAPVEFRWSSAVQTICGHCRSVVVRHDVDLAAVGVVADLPLSGSPIQIGTRGRFQGDSFTVTGRIVYEYEHGTWNEWHLLFADERRTQIDMRFAKILRFAGRRVDIGVDLSNLLNTNYATTYENGYQFPVTTGPVGGTWGNPTAIYSPRFVRWNVTFDF